MKPLFMPTIYEHAAFLINAGVSETARDLDLLVKASVTAYETYLTPMAAVGMDIYNIEAEALGCEVRYSANAADIPSVVGHPLASLESVSQAGLNRRNLPDPGQSGRMPLMVKSARKVRSLLGDDVPVVLPICGPFSIAAELRSFNRIIEDSIFDVDGYRELLEFAATVSSGWGRSLIAEGFRIVMFESWATPPLVSPKMYREHIAPYEARVIAELKSAGASAVPLVIGGNTSDIADDIISTGTTLLVADYCVNISEYKQKAKKAGISLRCNIDPKLIRSGQIDEILNAAKRIISQAGDYEKFILGSGVVPYDTPPEKLKCLKALSS